MNINPIILELAPVVNCPVVPDLYTGNESRWIVFTYADERGALYGDNNEYCEQATIQITYYTPANYNYMADKKLIKDALAARDFQIQSIQSWMETDEKAALYVRHTVFTVYYVGVDN